jgi:hypothetical protein
MHQVASDLNKAKREPFFDALVVDWNHREYSTGDSLQKDIFGWLSPPDPWKNHHSACKSRHDGTAEWFIQGDTYSEWRTSEVPSSLLWVHGKRLFIPSSYGSTETKFSFFGFAAGAGKSVFWYVKYFIFPTRELIEFDQLYNHRRHPCYAESWTRGISIFLL